MKITLKNTLFIGLFLAPALYFANKSNIPMTMVCLGALNAFINISYTNHGQ